MFKFASRTVNIKFSLPRSSKFSCVQVCIPNSEYKVHFTPISRISPPPNGQIPTSKIFSKITQNMNLNSNNSQNLLKGIQNQHTMITDLSPPNSSGSENGSIIILQVGERRFTTFRSTLTEQSDFFKARLSGNWATEQLEDGAYFIDADPTLFEHILGYLRRGMFPLFYDVKNGHCHHRYLELLEEARYFQIPKLIKWLDLKVYRHVLKVEYFKEQAFGPGAQELLSKPLEHHTLLSTWERRMIYICPRGIRTHRGDPSQCGGKCHSAQGGEPLRYEEEKLMKLVIMSERIVVDEKLCKDGWDIPERAVE